MLNINLSAPKIIKVFFFFFFFFWGGGGGGSKSSLGYILLSTFEKDPSDGFVLTSAGRVSQSLEPTTGKEYTLNFVLTKEIG